MAGQSWLSLSEIVCGHILKGGLAPDAVVVSDFAPPVDALVRAIKERKTTDANRLAEIVGVGTVGACLQAATECEGLPLDWPRLLRGAAARHRAGAVLGSLAERLQRGEAVDISAVYRAIADMEEERNRLVPLSEVDPDRDFWRPCGFPALDAHLGGVPKEFPTVIGAPPGTGKTSLASALAIAAARRGERVIIFTLEMTSRYLLGRMMDLDRMPKKVRDNIWVCDEIIPIEEIVATASQAAVDGVGMVVVDFADLVILGEETEQKMASVYRGMQKLSKNLGCPVILIAQINRRYTRNGEVEIPKLTDLRYSGMAEALCGMVLFLHNPWSIYAGEVSASAKALLPKTPGKAYLVVAKTKGGYGVAGEFGDYGGPGAIQVGWSGEKGWDTKDKGLWYPL